MVLHVKYMPNKYLLNEYAILFNSHPSMYKFSLKVVGHLIAGVCLSMASAYSPALQKLCGAFSNESHGVACVYTPATQETEGEALLGTRV